MIWFTTLDLLGFILPVLWLIGAIVPSETR